MRRASEGRSSLARSVHPGPPAPASYEAPEPRRCDPSGPPRSGREAPPRRRCCDARPGRSGCAGPARRRWMTARRTRPCRQQCGQRDGECVCALHRHVLLLRSEFAGSSDSVSPTLQPGRSLLRIGRARANPAESLRIHAASIPERNSQGFTMKPERGRGRPPRPCFVMKRGFGVERAGAAECSIFRRPRVACDLPLGVDCVVGRTDVGAVDVDVRLDGRVRDPAADLRVPVLVAPRAVLPVPAARVGRLHAVQGPQARGRARPETSHHPSFVTDVATVAAVGFTLARRRSRTAGTIGCAGETS